MHKGLLIFIIFIGVTVFANAEKSLRDPTRPLTFTEKSERVQLNLQAIYLKNGSKRAVINGTLVSEGERFQSHLIKVIEKNRVVYQYQGQTSVLRLRPNLIKSVNN